MVFILTYICNNGNISSNRVIITKYLLLMLYIPIYDKLVYEYEKKRCEKMIDFHSHILPNIDDGSSGVEESLLMLQKETKDGVTNVVVTPHYYADRYSLEGFLKNREKSFEALKEHLTEEYPILHTAAEVFYFTDMGEASMLSRLCIGSTRTLLLELPFVQWTGKMIKDVEKIVKNQQINVILAHIERYYDYQKDKGIFYEMLDLPVYKQVNSGPLLIRSRRKLVLDLLKNGWVDIMGSDCHNTDNRPPNLLEGRKVIEKKLGTQILEQIDSVGAQILKME